MNLMNKLGSARFGLVGLVAVAALASGCGSENEAPIATSSPGTETGASSATSVNTVAAAPTTTPQSAAVPTPTTMPSTSSAETVGTGPAASDPGGGAPGSGYVFVHPTSADVASAIAADLAFYDIYNPNVVGGECTKIFPEAGPCSWARPFDLIADGVAQFDVSCDYFSLEAADATAQDYVSEAVGGGTIVDELAVPAYLEASFRRVQLRLVFDEVPGVVPFVVCTLDARPVYDPEIADFRDVGVDAVVPALLEMAKKAIVPA